MCVYMCMCVRACVCMCVCEDECVCVREGESVHSCIRKNMLSQFLYDGFCWSSIEREKKMEKSGTNPIKEILS